MNRRAQFGMPVGDDNPITTTPFVNWTLIAANIVVFLISLTNLEAFVTNYGFTPAQFSMLTMFTSMFLHGGIAHIVGNMLFLWIFGDNIEDRIGHTWYLIFYLVCGVAATLLHYVLNLGSTIPAVGASGAISGVLGAYLVLFPHAKVRVAGGYGLSTVPAFIMLGLWFVVQLFGGFAGLFGDQAGIAFWAHVGGFIAGVILGLVIKAVKK